jgi:hypothetical protein
MYDHIIYNPERLRVKELLEIPQESQLSPSGACKNNPLTEKNHVTLLPNIVYPSSHLRIEAVMEFIYEPTPTSAEV